MHNATFRYNYLYNYTSSPGRTLSFQTYPKNGNDSSSVSGPINE